MNILCVTPAYRPGWSKEAVGGGEISNRLLLEALAARGHSVTVVAINGGGSRFMTANGVEIAQARHDALPKPLSQLYGYLTYSKRCQSISKARQPDIILAATSGLPVALNLAKKFGLPCGLLVRAFEHFPGDYPSLPAVRNWMAGCARRLLVGSPGVAAVKSCTFLLPNSEYMARVCREYAPEVRSYVIYPPLEVDLVRRRRTRAVRSVAVVGTGSHKGTETVDELADRIPELQFKILGSPGLGSSVVSEGNVTRFGWCDVPVHFRAVDIVIAPSICREAFGRVAVEGLAAGAVVIVSDIGGLPEAVGYEPCLLVSPPESVEAWEVKIRQVMRDPAPYVEASRRARNGVIRFGLREQVDVLEEVLRLENPRNRVASTKTLR